jgi:hypothetical protein
VTGPVYLLPELDAQTVRTLQIHPSGQPDIRVERTNNGWQLTAPVNYPAQSTNVQKLLEALQMLTVPHRIPENELRSNPKAAEDYGIEPPQLTLIFDSGPPILIGHRTSPGDQVFVRIPGREGVAVVDSSVLNLFPQSANDWRDKRLADTTGLAFDRIVVTNSTRSQWSFVLQQDPTNRLWGMTFPLKVRADSEKVDDALQRLQKLHVHDFVSDEPKPDLESYGLQTPALTVALGQGTNSVLALDFGKELTNSPGLIYARRRDQTAVVTLSTNALAQWNASYDVFRDRHLVTMLGPIASVRVAGQDEFTLQWQTNNTWRVLPQNYPADQTLATHLVRTLSELQVANFERDSVSEVLLPQYPQYGLAKPARQFTISWTPSTTATNAPTTIDFGVNTNNQVFARRIGEDAVYGINPADFEALPSASWEMRDRRIWDFESTNVARITIHQNGQTREIVRKGATGWALATNSSGTINLSAIEDTVRALGHLTAFSWVGHGTDKLAGYGFDPKGYELSIELKNGNKLTLRLGGDARLDSAYASVPLDGEPWIFEFPPDVLPSLVYSLMIHTPPP